MGLHWSLGLILLLALTSRATSLSIPLEVEQLPTIIAHTSSPVVALPFDDSFTMRCEAKGNPVPEYRWTKDGEDFVPPPESWIETGENNGSFVLHSMDLNQFQGSYRCYASNKLGTAMTEEIHFIVSSVPKFPKEKIEPIVVEVGEPFVLTCNPPEGLSPRQIYWMSLGLEQIEQDERVSMSENGDLYFSNALERDSRQDYYCYASFIKIRTIVQKIAMSVVVKSLEDGGEVDNNGVSNIASWKRERKPSLLLPPDVQTEVVLVKGQELRLECIAEGLPTPTVDWMKMGEDLPDRAVREKSGKLLSIPNVNEQDDGKYMCKAKNALGEAVHYFDVIVEEPPKWLMEPPQGQLVVIDSDVHIKCSATGKPQPEITWRRNGQILTDEPSNQLRVLDDTVVLHGASASVSGVYQCEVSNRHGSLLANINIMVLNLAPLMLTKDNLEYAVVQGGDMTLSCSVFSSPPPAVYWAKVESPETISGERFTTLHNGSLRIVNVEKEDSGEYVCFATNTEGKSAITAVLNVKDSTRIVDPPQDLQIISGTTAQLLCKAEYDRTLGSSFRLVWRKDGDQIPLALQEHSRYFVGDDMLQIMNVNQSDQGRYTCIAKTHLDQDNASAVLTVLDVPDAPENVKVVELTIRSVQLSWMPGRDHNSSITEYVVEYEEDQWEPGRWRELLTVPGNQATAKLDLNGYLNYQFRVYAINAVGPGPPSDPTEIYRSPPTAPDRNPENVKIQGRLPHQMDISWEPLSPIEHNGPGLEYKVSYRKLGLEDVWKEHLVKRHSFMVKNTPTFIPYEIKIQSRNSHGWGPEAKVVTGYSGEDVPTAAPRDVAVEVINATFLRVSWTRVPLATVRGHLEGYIVNWQRNRSLLTPEKIPDERGSLLFPGNRSHGFVSGLRPYSEYRLTVNVHNKKGNGPHSDPVTFRTPEGAPEKVPILTASNAQKDSIALVWGPPLETNGVLTGYLLQYQRINESSMEVGDPLIVKVNGADSTQWLLQGLEENGALYRFDLRACTRTGCGPALSEEGRTSIRLGQAGAQSNVSTQGWFIGTMCAVALLTLTALIACFVRRNKGGKYAGTPPPSTQQPDLTSSSQVKEKEDLHPDVESQGMNDDTYCEYSDSEEKPLKDGSLSSSCREGAGEDGISRDSLVDYADGEGEFNEDGSFIGEYSGRKHPGSVGEPYGSVTA